MARSAILWPAGMASSAVTRDAVHAQFGAGRDGHARHRDVVGGVQMNG